MASILNWITGKKSVIVVSSLEEQTRDGINKAYIPKFLYKPPFGYPRFANMGYIRYLAQTPYVQMCVKTIIDEIAAIEWDIVPVKGMEDEADEVEMEHIRNFFNNPNTNKETFEQVFIRMPVRDLLEINSGILNKVYNKREEMVEIVARDGATFTKNPNIHGMYTFRDDIILPNIILKETMTEEVSNPYQEITASSARERAAYFQYGWIAGPIPIPFGKKEIIWLESMKRSDEHYGWSPVQTVAKTLQMLIYQIDSDLEYYNKNNVPKGIIGLEDSDAEEIEAFKEQWTSQQETQDEFGSMKKIMNRVPITNKTPVFTRIEFSSSEMQIIEKQKWYTKLVWASFGVTGVELGYTEDAKGSANQIVQSKVFKKKAINPILRNLESSFNINIISEFEYVGFMKTDKGKEIEKQKYEFKFKTFDVDEEKAKAELYKLQVENFKTVNEIRQEEGLEDIEGGDDAPTPGNRQGDSFGFGDEDGEDRNFGDMEDDANDTDEDPQTDVDQDVAKKKGKKSLNSTKAQPISNPLILKENERPTGYTRLEKAMKYVLKQNEKEIKEILTTAIGKDTLKEVKDFSSIIQKIKSILSIATLKSITYSIIRNNYMKGFDIAEKHLDMNLIPDQDAIDYMANYTYDNIKGMNDDIAQKLRQVMQRGFIDGKGVDGLKADITKVFDVGENRVSMIARTESNRAANFGRLHAYMKSGEKGKKVYSAHIDNRTSPLCKRLDGQQKDLDEDFDDPKGEWKGPSPPSHVNCRSSFTFELDD